MPATSVSWLAFALAVLLCAPLVWSASLGGGYWYSDAPRHALNGVFILDLLRDLPLRGPQQWAMDYYAQYPALTVLFYPPALSVVLAGFYAVLGVSPLTAQIAVLATYVAAIGAAFAIARRLVGTAAAVGVAVAFAYLPEVALWGRQVMLELPTYACLLWCTFFVIRAIESGRTADVVWAVALAVLALYAKQTAIAVLLVLFGTLFIARRELLRAPRVWWTLLLAAILMAPLAWMTVHFGQTNLQSMMGVPDTAASRRTLQGWLWYAQRLPEQAGWVLAVAGPVALMAAPFVVTTARLRTIAWMLLAWVVASYVFFSFIELKDARFTIFLLFPLVLACALIVERFGGRRACALAMAALAAQLAGLTLTERPVPTVDGYRDAARWLVEHEPNGATLMFSGYRDGSFIFNLRSIDERRRFRVIRSDKVLLRVAVRREAGVNERSVSPDDLDRLFHDYGIKYVVLEPQFWADLQNMRMFVDYVESPRFRLLHTVEVRSRPQQNDRTLRIYESRMPRASQPKPLTIDLDMVGRSVTSQQSR